MESHELAVLEVQLSRLAHLASVGRVDLLEKSFRFIRNSLEEAHRCILAAKAQRRKENQGSAIACSLSTGTRKKTVHSGQAQSGSRAKKTFVSPPEMLSLQQHDPTEKRQAVHQSVVPGCHVCKQTFHPGKVERHDQFRNHCETCGTINVVKRNQKADLTGRIAVVTGARIKIGYLTALRLLRCGATVIATSRFAPTMRARYVAEADSQEWLSRLHVYELDLCVPTQTDNFVRAVERAFPHLDILINNAAQTIRRPAAYYQRLRLESAAHFLRSNSECEAVARISASKEDALDVKSTISFVNPQSQLASPISVSNVYHPPICVPDQDMVSLEQVNQWLPSGAVDVENDNEPLDLRPDNSWMVRPEHVDAREMAEVLLTNVLAPVVLSQRFHGMLKRSPHKRRYIVQVSSMEGCFSREKTSHHVHTNMGKASLNMFVRTASYAWARNDNIFQTAADTGWCTDEKPRTPGRYFATPLDCEDGAARVLDPILGSENGTYNEPPFGVFLKDYKPTHW